MRYNGVIDIYDNVRIDNKFFTKLSDKPIVESSCDGNHKIICMRTGTPDSLYRKALLTGELGNIKFKNKLKLDYTELDLLNDRESDILKLSDNRKYEHLKSTLGEENFEQEYGLKLEFSNISPYYYAKTKF